MHDFDQHHLTLNNEINSQKPALSLPQRLQQFLYKTPSQSLTKAIPSEAVLAPVRDHVLFYLTPTEKGSKYLQIKTITKHESAYKAFPRSPGLATERWIYKPAVNTEQ